MKPNIKLNVLPEGGLRLEVERFIRHYFELHGDYDYGSGLYAHVLREVEIPLITETLKITGGNQLKAAHILGLNRNTLRKKIKELKIRIPSNKPGLTLVSS